MINLNVHIIQIAKDESQVINCLVLVTICVFFAHFRTFRHAVAICLVHPPTLRPMLVRVITEVSKDVRTYVRPVSVSL